MKGRRGILFYACSLLLNQNKIVEVRNLILAQHFPVEPESKAAGGIVTEMYFSRVPKARHPSNSTQTNTVSAVWSGQCAGNQRA